MIDDIQSDAEERMEKSLEALGQNFNKIRTALKWHQTGVILVAA